MLDLEKLKQLSRDAGFTHMRSLDVSTIRLYPEVRDMCAGNTCGQYEKNWSCPPGCGTLAECRRRIAEYPEGILVQTVGEIEDSFDLEAMTEIERRHKAQFVALYRCLRGECEDILPLGAGCCTRCKECAYPDGPCRFPQEMISSLEAYGILVSELCRANGLGYYYGPDRLAFTSCLLFR